MKYSLFFSLLINFLGFSQPSEIVLIDKKPLSFDYDICIGIDAFDYIYYIKNNVFIKEKATEKWEYKNVSLGNLYSVDLTNPLKIVLFYKDFNTVLLVDNQLNETQRIVLNNKEVGLMTSIAQTASQNRLWLFNENNQQLGLYSFLNQSFKPLQQPFTAAWQTFFSTYNTFFWIDISNNWYVCDVFGNINLIANIENSEEPQLLSANEILFLKENQLYYFNRITNQKINIPIEKKSIKGVTYLDQILTIFTQSEMFKFKINQP